MLADINNFRSGTFTSLHGLTMVCHSTHSLWQRTSRNCLPYHQALAQL